MGQEVNAFEQKIADTVNKKLNDGTVEKLVEQHMEKGVSEALEKIFSWDGEGMNLLEKKLGETIVLNIEQHDFNKYLTKLDATLTEIVNATTLSDNKKILENFKGLMKEPEMKEIKLSEIFEQYCKHVAKNVCTDDLKARCEDGELYYEHVTAQMEVEHEEKGLFVSGFDDCKIKLTCDEDEDLNCQLKLYKLTYEKNWRILRYGDSIDVSSLRCLSDFDVFLMSINRGFVHIIMDCEIGCNDDIEPEEKPEWSLS